MLARFGPTMHPSVHQWGDCFGQKGPILAAKISPGDQFWLQKLVRGTIFLRKFVQGDRFWCDRTLSIDLDQFSMESETLLVPFKA